jgi:hypothetical protein
VTKTEKTARYLMAAVVAAQSEDGATFEDALRWVEPTEYWMNLAREIELSIREHIARSNGDTAK